jgi:ATP-dependent DNA ligase
MIKRHVPPAGFIEPCIPILAHKPPAGAQWAHEIKHDGYRLIVRRDGERLRLFTRRGYDGLEGIVSKRLDKPYRSGRSGDWIKTKNPDSPAMQRFRER